MVGAEENLGHSAFQIDYKQLKIDNLLDIQTSGPRHCLSGVAKMLLNFIKMSPTMAGRGKKVAF